MDYKYILSKYGINKTKFRVDLLKIFSLSKKSFSVDDILNIFNNKINKVTIYRALDNFEKKGLIHQVPHKFTYKKYALCNHNECNENNHNHNHGHFVCFSCNQTFCLDMKLPETTILKDFNVTGLSLTAEGYCNNCY